MIAIRSGRGLGDNLYLQSIVRHLVGQGKKLEVCTPWSDLFLPLARKVTLAPFRRNRIDRVAHYIERKSIAGTDQFVDCCISAGIKEPVDLRLDWDVMNAGLVADLQRSGRPIILVQLPRAPMGRSDGYGLGLLPDCRAIQRLIDLIEPHAFVVQIGSGDPLYRFTGIDLDLANRTTVTDLLDAASVASGAIGYCSFLVPLMESFRKPALFVWSRAGLQSNNEFIRAIVPAKILHRSSSRVVMDDCSQPELIEAVDELCRQIGSSAVV